MISSDRMFADAREVANAITSGAVVGTEAIAKAIYKFAVFQAQYERLACQAIALEYGSSDGEAIANLISTRHHVPGD